MHASVVWDWLSATRALVYGYGEMLTFVRFGLPSWERKRAVAELEAAAIQQRNREVHLGDDHGDD